MNTRLRKLLTIIIKISNILLNKKNTITAKIYKNQNNTWKNTKIN